MYIPTIIKERLKDTKGYYIVEAAIFLPVFILAIVTIAFLMKVVTAGEVIMHASCDEAHNLAVNSYAISSDAGFKTTLKNRVINEGENVLTTDVKNLRYLYEDEETYGLISFNVNTVIDFNLPFDLHDDIEVKNSLLCRAWVGKENDGTSFPFSEMEKNESGKTVWVFPESGTHYHGENCTYVANKPQEMILSDEVKKKYEPCKKCDPDDLKNGSMVYCFKNYGEVYHRGSCRYVDKYVTSMDVETAKEKGYLPCSKCGGK